MFFPTAFEDLVALVGREVFAFLAAFFADFSTGLSFPSLSAVTVFFAFRDLATGSKYRVRLELETGGSS